MATRISNQSSLSPHEVGLKYGFRSGLEDQVASQLLTAGVPVVYEEHVISYLRPARKAKYTPDFILPNGIIIETKGRFVTVDRQKHILIKNQHPELDVRFVFSNPNSRISKQSKTTYAMWCEKNNFLYAKGLIPGEWLAEEPDRFRLAALKQIGISIHA